MKIICLYRLNMYVNLLHARTYAMLRYKIILAMHACIWLCCIRVCVGVGVCVCVCVCARALLQLNGVSITLCQLHLISSDSAGTNSQLGGS